MPRLCCEAEFLCLICVSASQGVTRVWRGHHTCRNCPSPVNYECSIVVEWANVTRSLKFTHTSVIKTRLLSQHLRALKLAQQRVRKKERPLYSPLLVHIGLQKTLIFIPTNLEMILFWLLLGLLWIGNVCRFPVFVDLEFRSKNKFIQPKIT